MAAMVRGARDGQPIDVRLARDSSGRWSLDGDDVPAVAGCIDVDLAFSPATNLLSLRRLELEVGQEAAVVAAWVTFPELSLAPLRQVYRRTSRNTYAYDAPDLDFAATLRVDGHGFVLDYGDLWHAESAAGTGA